MTTCANASGNRPARVALVLAVLLALAGGTLVAGCSRSDDGTGVMMTAPIIMQDPRLDFTRFTGDRADTTVQVLYATTRAPAPDGDPQNYLRSAGDVPRLGAARVQLGEPGWTFEELVASDRVSRVEEPRPARVLSVDEMGTLGSEAAERAFLEVIDRHVATSRKGEAVIYVPGYRATFNHVMRLMGSWAHYLGGSSAVVAFSWPTGTQAWSYITDCPRARAFIPDIERLIALVGERSKARRVNVVGFSCGSPLLAEALVNLRNRHPGASAEELQRRYRIGNALFIAADIDLQTFARAHLPALSELAARTQVYLSEDDRALVFAAKLAGASRLGRPNFDELSREDLETLASNERLVGVDVAGVYGAHETTGMRGHGYWFANQRVSTDVLLSMLYPFDPTWRGLDHVPGPGLWTFPDDYPERIGRAVYEAAPELRREPAGSPPGNPAPDR